MKNHISSTLDTLLVCLASIGSILWLAVFTKPSLATASEKVRFWTVANSVEDIVLFRELANEFRRETGITVEITPLGWGDYSQKYLTAMAAGVAPDVGVAGHSSPMEWGSVGGLVALDQEFPDETQKLTENFLPGMLDQFRFQNKLYGLPTDLVTTLVYYRRDIFRRLGLTPPKTWNDLISTIQTLEQNNYRFYIGWTKSEQWALSYYYMPYGYSGPHYKNGKPQLEWLDTGYQKAVQFALELWYTHGELGMLPPDRQVARFLSDIPDESIPLMVDGNWMVPIIQEYATKTNFEWGVAPWPRANHGEPNNLIGGTSYVIFKESRHKKAAMTWLQYLLSLKIQQRMLVHRAGRSGQTANFNISPLKAMWTDTENNPFWQQKTLEPFRDAVSALGKIAWTFKSVPKVLGFKEVDHLEDQVLDRMRSFILEKIAEIAKHHDLSTWEYIKKTARHPNQKERKKLRQEIKNQIKLEYESVYPQALGVMQHELDSYSDRFSPISPSQTRETASINILRILEWLVVAIIGGITTLILATKRLRLHIAAYLMIGTPVVIALFFVVIPMLTSLYLSFTEYHAILPLNAAKWVGIKHYLTSFQWSNSDNVLVSMRRTLLYIAASLPLGIGFSLIFAFLLNQDLIGKRLWRFLYFSPLVTSSVAVALIFTQLYAETKSGWLNHALLQLGIIKNPLLLLRDEKTFLYCVIGLAIWHSLAFTILIFLAGLQQIPTVLYKAAEVDGAGFWKKFWHVSLPGLRPQIIFVVMMGIIGGFQVFEPIYMMGGGSGYVGSKFGPNDSGKTMVPLVFDLGFERFKMGQASAVAYILFAIIFGITVLQLRLLRKYNRGDM